MSCKRSKISEIIKVEFVMACPQKLYMGDSEHEIIIPKLPGIIPGIPPVIPGIIPPVILVGGRTPPVR